MRKILPTLVALFSLLTVSFGFKADNSAAKTLLHTWKLSNVKAEICLPQCSKPYEYSCSVSLNQQLSFHKDGTYTEMLYNGGKYDKKTTGSWFNDAQNAILTMTEAEGKAVVFEVQQLDKHSLILKEVQSHSVSAFEMM